MTQQIFRMPLSSLSRGSVGGRKSEALGDDLPEGSAGGVPTGSTPLKTGVFSFSALSLSTQPLHVRQLPGFEIVSSAGFIVGSYLAMGTGGSVNACLSSDLVPGVGCRAAFTRDSSAGAEGERSGELARDRTAVAICEGVYACLN